MTKKLIKYLAIIFCIFIQINFCNAQINSESKRTNWWYFGQGAGIDWTSGSPVVVSNGQTNTYEGAASISDLNGNLLFYSDGNTIWNKNHIPMQNGNDLLGCNGIPTAINVAQNALILQHPGNDSLYYLFHLGCLDFQTYTLKYTIVNIKLNAGLGNVVSANNPLMTTRLQALAACRHANGCSVWVMGIDTLQKYNFFKFSTTGLDINNPVKQFMQLNYPIPQGANAVTVFSSDLTKMASVAYTGIGSDSLLIYQFNNSTAVITSPIKICTNDQEVYSLCFSPDSKKLYAGGENPGGTYINKLFQFDLTNYNSASVLVSKTVIYSDSLFFGYMQIGLNNKIYIARGSFSFVYGNDDSLAVINNPNALGLACNFNFNAVYLNGKQCLGSLPNFDQGYFYPALVNTCVTSIEELQKDDFKLYPNPTAEYVIIKNTQGFDFEVLIFDINGGVILKNTIISYENKKINLSNIKNGIYTIQLKNSTKVLNYKLIKN